MKTITMFLMLLLFNLKIYCQLSSKVNDEKYQMRPNMKMFKGLVFVNFKNQYILNPSHNWGLESKLVEIDINPQEIFISYKTENLKHSLSIPLLKYYYFKIKYCLYRGFIE